MEHFHDFYSHLFLCTENKAASQNDKATEPIAVQTNVRVPENDTISEEAYEPEGDYARPSHVAPRCNYELWKSTYAEVLEEPAQADWQRISAEVLAGKHGHQARDWWYENADVDIRADRYLSKKPDGGDITANAMKT